MTNQSLINIILVLFIFCFSLSASAHTNEKSQAQLFLLEDNKYAITLSVDFLHLLKKELNIEGDDIEVIFHLKSLSLTETRSLLSKLKEKLSSQSQIFFDGSPENIADLSGLTLAQIRRFTQANTVLTEYSVELHAVGEMPSDANKVQLRFAEILGDVILTVSKPAKTFLMSNSTSKSFSTTKSLTIESTSSSIETFVEYVYQGFIHIIPKGLDHILFVLALFLFTHKTSTLLWQISAFTLAHTITLALGIFQVVSLPSNIVEPIIALSIIYVAVENIYLRKLSKWRLPLIFAFGLLHGLGFASVLLELGLASEQYLLSLISFNVGVELGQITVVLVALLLSFWCFNKAWYRQRVVIPSSIVIAVMASYWFVERVL